MTTRTIAAGSAVRLRAGRPGRRLAQLYLGLVLYGLSLAVMVRTRLGLAPWDVLHSGLATHLPLDLGGALVVVSFVVLLAWIPLRERPGLGTISNAVLIGVFAQAFLGLIPPTWIPGAWWVRLPLSVAGVVLCGVASALYIGAGLGPGPRDGLMTGLSRRTGWSLRSVRTGLEVSVVVVGLVLGGRLGVGTVLFALGIGPVTQAVLPRVRVQVAQRVDVIGELGTEARHPGSA